VTPLVIAFSKVPSVTRFVFTGGDPFLYIEEIIEIMRSSRTAGVTQPFHIVTSGYWAKSDEIVSELLERLKLVGLDALCLSHDHEHARWVPADHIKRIATHSLIHGIAVNVFGIFWNKNEHIEDLLPPLDGVEMFSNVALSIGSARKLYGIGPRYNFPEEKKYSCGRPLSYEVSIYPNGEVYPCCSGGFNKEAKLLCGNAFNDDPAAIIENVYKNFHVRIAKEVGFDKLYERVRETRPDLYGRLPSFAQRDSVCEVCRDLHSSQELQEALTPVYEEMEVDYILDRMESTRLFLEGKKEFANNTLPVLAQKNNHKRTGDTA
jgi:MoaA/NifB/PqqE/SkfB family radical SAM enzyme